MFGRAVHCFTKNNSVGHFKPNRGGEGPDRGQTNRKLTTEFRSAKVKCVFFELTRGTRIDRLTRAQEILELSSIGVTTAQKFDLSRNK